MNNETQAAAVPLPSELDTTVQEVPRISLERLRAEQNLGFAWLGGGGAAILGAVLWAVITVVTDYQIGWMAVGVGALVGWAIRQLGKGIDPMYGWLGAGWALIGCALGNLLTVCAYISNAEGIPLLALLPQLSFPIVQELMVATFSPIDVVFYALAVYTGYSLAFRQVDAATVAPSP